MPDHSRRVISSVRRAMAFVTLAAILLLATGDYRPGMIDLAVAPYRFSIVGWELRNLPDKWLRPAPAAPPAIIREYFADGRRLRDLARRIIALESGAAYQSTGDRSSESGQLDDLRREQAELRDRQSDRRAGVETALEETVADALRSLGFGGVTGGVFPPVDTVLTGSPTVLVISPRDRIARQGDIILQTGLPSDRRAAIEAAVEQDDNRSALVVNTGGIAFYPSIAVPDGGLDFTLEIIAHEWVHHWLWFRPLGRRYFQGSDITAINETVADIAGKEISALARQGLPDDALTPSSIQSDSTAKSDSAPAPTAGGFDFSAEMRATRVRIDDLLAAGDVAGAESYMEERRRVFVANGYYIRRLNQAYFAFHGTYATTGAAGVSVIGEQVAELRRRSPSLAHFLRTAAQITEPQDLSDYLDGERR